MSFADEFFDHAFLDGVSHNTKVVAFFENSSCYRQHSGPPLCGGADPFRKKAGAAAPRRQSVNVLPNSTTHSFDPDPEREKTLTFIAQQLVNKFTSRLLLSLNL